MKLYYISRTVIAKCFVINRKNYNFLDCDWFKKLLFSTNSLNQVVIGQFVIGQRCCVGGVHYKIIWFY